MGSFRDTLKTTDSRAFWRWIFWAAVGAVTSSYQVAAPFLGLPVFALWWSVVLLVGGVLLALFAAYKALGAERNMILFIVTGMLIGAACGWLIWLSRPAMPDSLAKQEHIEEIRNLLSGVNSKLSRVSVLSDALARREFLAHEKDWISQAEARLEESWTTFSLVSKDNSVTPNSRREWPRWIRSYDLVDKVVSEVQQRAVAAVGRNVEIFLEPAGAQLATPAPGEDEVNHQEKKARFRRNYVLYRFAKERIEVFKRDDLSRAIAETDEQIRRYGRTDNHSRN